MIAQMERIPVSLEHLRRRLVQSRSYWICTTRPDGRPHATPVWGVWIADRLYFGTSPTSVKARNLLERPQVVVHLDSADDLVVVEGVLEDPTPEQLAVADDAYAAKYVLPRTGEECRLIQGEGPGTFAVRPLVARTWLEQAFEETMTRWTFGADGEVTPHAMHYP
jgi:hypothetical protein